MMKILSSRLSRTTRSVAILFSCLAMNARAELLVERTVMPGAAPSSFAVGFPNGISFCYDPVRGGIDYVWRGGFIDLTSVRPGPGKLIKPVELRGSILYRENGPAPLRRGDNQRLPEIKFKGYSLQEDAITFRYTVDGTPVEEEVRLRKGGDSLIRYFRVQDAARDSRWWYLPGTTEGTAWTAIGGQRETNGFHFTLERQEEFSLELPLSRQSP